MNRSEARRLSAEYPIGDPFGGPAYGRREDPITIVTVASTVFGVVSAISQGNAAKKAADYNAQINTQNAAIARQNASDKAKQVDRDNYLRLGAIRANTGKNGGEGDTGSVLDVLGDVAAQGELDKQYTIYQGELQARGYTNTATLDSYQGENAQTSGYLKAGSELLGGGYDYFGGNKLKRA